MSWIDDLGDQPIRVWLCPAGHSETPWTTEERMTHWARGGPTVEWRDGVAHCLKPDCQLTSERHP